MQLHARTQKTRQRQKSKQRQTKKNKEKQRQTKTKDTQHKGLVKTKKAPSQLFEETSIIKIS